MIKSDQFPNLPAGLLVVFSSREDGTVLDRTYKSQTPDILATRRKICEQVGTTYEDVVFQKITYSEAATYNTIIEVDHSSSTRFVPGVEADGLFTRMPGVGLFLPVADCIVTSIYDPQKRILAQLHMGRHSTLTDILDRMIAKFIEAGSQPNELCVWMAPAATKDTYSLAYFDHANDPEWKDFYEKKPDGYHLDLQGFNRARLLSLGVSARAITISPINTMTDHRYFSHAAGDTTGRFAGIALMR